MADGEVLALVLDGDGGSQSELQDVAYQSLLHVNSEKRFWLWALLLTYGLGVLSYFDVVTKLEPSGMEISTAVFDHLSLTLISLASLFYRFALAKTSYTQAWFSWRFKNASSAERAKMLLKYPEAMWPMNYIPHYRGWPKHMFPKRTSLPQLIYVILTLAAVGLYFAGANALWLALAYEVLLSDSVANLISYATVVASALVSLLAMFVPTFNDVPKTYEHFGLSDRLASARPERVNYFHGVIHEIMRRNELMPEPKGAFGRRVRKMLRL
jgi:hypothetical protein